MDQDTLVLTVGAGYWLIDDYPIGGCFRRVHEKPMAIHNPVEIPSFKGCGWSAVITATDERIAWSGARAKLKSEL